MTLWLLAAHPAFACATCVDPKEASRGAFVATTVFLSLLPLAMMGGILFFVWRRARAAHSGEGTPSVVNTAPCSSAS